MKTGGMTYERWLRMIGQTPENGEEWRRLGMIKTFNIEGDEFILREEHEEFVRLVKAGKFVGLELKLDPALASLDRTGFDGDE